MISPFKPLQIWLLTLTFILTTLAPVFAISQDNTLFSATYKGKLSGFSVKTTRTLIELAPNHYELKSVAKNAFASITEHSFFHVSTPPKTPTEMPVKTLDEPTTSNEKTSNTEKQFISEKYLYERKILGSNSQQQLLFDWNTLTAQYIRKDKPKKNKSHQISYGMLDPSLYQLKLQQDAYTNQKIFHYRYPKTWKINTMDFALNGKTTFQLNKKTYDGIRLKRINQQDEKQTHLVLIPDLYFQIAEITHIEKDGKTYSIKLTDFDANNQKLHEFYTNRLSSK